jgi:hypothetical protein
LALWMASLALPDAARRHVGNVFRAARRAYNAILPGWPMGHKIANAIVDVREVQDRFLKGGWLLDFAHTRTLS